MGRQLVREEERLAAWMLGRRLEYDLALHRNARFEEDMAGSCPPPPCHWFPVVFKHRDRGAHVLSQSSREIVRSVVLANLSS